MLKKVLCSLTNQNKDKRDVFYYRMFEAFKLLINDKIKRCQGSKNEIKEKLMALYEIIEELLPYRQAIIDYYRFYYEYPFVEAWRDKKLLNPKTSKKTFEKIIDKQVEK